MKVTSIFNVAYLSIAAAFAGLLLASIAQAQSAPLINASVTAGTSTPASGTNGVTISTLTLTAPQSGEYGAVQVHSVPLTLTTSNGGVASSLASCQLFNANGTAVTGMVNPTGSSNTFTFDAPIALSGGASQTYTVRCNVGANAPSGGTYVFSAGTPTLAPSLNVTLTPTQTLQRGAQDAVVGVLTLSAARSSADIDVAAVPITVAFSSGASASTLSDCRVRLASDTTKILTNGTNAPQMSGGLTTFRFDVPQSVPAGSTFTYVITCDVDASAPANATIDMTLAPATVSAVVADTNAAVIPTRGFASGSSVVGPVSGTVRVSPTTPTPTPTPTPTIPDTTGPNIPGVPNTGLGFGALLTLMVSGFAVVFGSTFLARARA